MLPAVIRLAIAAEMALVVAEGTGTFHTMLPLGGTHVSQLGIVQGAALVVHELAGLVRDAIEHVKARRTHSADSAAAHKDR
jgi:hypothetical protein